MSVANSSPAPGAAPVWHAPRGNAHTPTMRPALVLMWILLAFHASTPSAAAPVATWNDLQSRPAPASTGLRIAYGRAPSQFGELRLPDAAGPHPVAVLIHGGCWSRGFDLRYLSHLADAITRDLGIATWNIEYRRLGEPGGGWPGTFLDAAQAVDHLRAIASSHKLDATRVVAVGHSAGGQLALWLASRPRLRPNSAVFRPQPLALRGAIGLAPIADLVEFGEGPGSCNAAVDDLMGGAPAQQLARYSQVSPRALLPLELPQWLIQGTLDAIVPLAGVEAYAEAARREGDRVELRAIPAAGHFEPVLPAGAAWDVLRDALRDLLEPATPQS
jgi:acetyl esterase/lipase